MKHFLYITALACAGALTACSADDSAHRAALAVDAQIDSLINAGNYTEALALVDTLNQKYPLEIELRKASDAKRAKALEGSAVTMIPKLDMQIAMARQQIDSLQQFFVAVKPNASLPAYMVPKNEMQRQLAAAPGVQVRVNMGQDAEDTPWTLAVNAGRNVGVDKVRAEMADGAAFDMRAVSADGSMATVSPEQAAAFAQACATQEVGRMVLSGSKGTVTVKTPANFGQSVWRAYSISGEQRTLREALAQREKTDRALTMARNRIAETAPAYIRNGQRPR